MIIIPKTIFQLIIKCLVAKPNVYKGHQLNSITKSHVSWGTSEKCWHQFWLNISILVLAKKANDKNCAENIKCPRNRCWRREKFTLRILEVVTQMIVFLILLHFNSVE